MNKTAHSAGPWKLRIEAEPDQFGDRSGYIWDAEGNLLFSTFFSHKNMKVTEADFWLVAKAPELKAALGSLLEALKNVTLKAEGPAGIAPLTVAITAITKAREVLDAI